jgi:hypothetical protein
MTKNKIKLEWVRLTGPVASAATRSPMGCTTVGSRYNGRSAAGTAAPAPVTPPGRRRVFAPVDRLDCNEISLLGATRSRVLRRVAAAGCNAVAWVQRYLVALPQPLPHTRKGRAMLPSGRSMVAGLVADRCGLATAVLDRHAVRGGSWCNGQVVAWHSTGTGVCTQPGGEPGVAVIRPVQHAA